MSIIHNKDQHEFVFTVENNELAGKLDYRYLSDTKLDAYHTEVLDKFQGKGIAGELYNALIKFAQQQNLTIKPSCSYIAAKMEKSNPDLIG